MSITIDVADPFDFTDSKGAVKRYPRGRHEVDEEMAEHWFVRAHLAGAPPPAPVPGSTEYAIEETRRKNRIGLIQAMTLEERQAVLDMLMADPALTKDGSGEPPREVPPDPAQDAVAAAVERAGITIPQQRSPEAEQAARARAEAERAARGRRR